MYHCCQERASNTALLRHTDSDKLNDDVHCISEKIGNNIPLAQNKQNLKMADKRSHVIKYYLSFSLRLSMQITNKAPSLLKLHEQRSP